MDIQILTGQLARPLLLDDEPVTTELIIGPNAKKPLRLEIPLFVSDMSFGALSEEAKTALARGAEMAGTGICSGEGGMLPEEQAANSRYFYELASARFGWNLDKVRKVQAFHFKGGQGAKTGTGGHLPGKKVSEKIAAVRRDRAGAVSHQSVAFSRSGITEGLRTPGHRSARGHGRHTDRFSSCPHNTWKPISTLFSKSAWTTSFWMGGAVQPARLRRFSRTTSPFRRWQRWRGPEYISISATQKASPSSQRVGCAPSRTSSKRWHWVPMGSRLRTRPFKPLGVSECARATRTIVPWVSRRKKSIFGVVS